MLTNKRKYFLYTHLFCKFYFQRKISVFFKWKYMSVYKLFIKFDFLKW